MQTTADSCADVSARAVSSTQRAASTFGLLALLFSFNSSSGAERSQVPLLRSAVERIAASTESHKLFFQLPEHITVQSGTELKLVLESSPEVPTDLFTITLSFNGVGVLTRPGVRISGGGSAAERMELKAPIPERAPLPGWNRVEISFIPSETLGKQTLTNSTWLLRKSDCTLSLAYSRLPLFPELGRFPQSFGEEKLLQGLSHTNGLFVTLVLPKVLRDVHLRACAILGARFGQLEYFTDADYDVVLANPDSWRERSGNSVFVGTWDEIGQARIVTNCVRLAKRLGAGQGLIAEGIIDAAGAQHRCLIASGADDVGLEKAILALGSSSALATIEASPAIMSELPPVSETRPASKIDGLHQAARLLVPDESLQSLTFVAPLNSSARELRTLMDLALHAGHNVPRSSALLPQAYGYDEAHRVPTSVLRGKSVLLLGSAKQWGRALSSDPSVPMAIPEPVEGRVRMQGRTYPIAQFEPSLAFLQMAKFPHADQVLVAGGWESFDSPRLKWMLTDPAAPAKVYGTFGAMDTQGRVASYDTRRPEAESLAERIIKYIPRDVSFEQTERLVRGYEAQETRTNRINVTVFYVFGALFAFFVAARLFLLWDRARSRQKALRTERPVPAQ